MVSFSLGGVYGLGIHVIFVTHIRELRIVSDGNPLPLRASRCRRLTPYPVGHSPGSLLLLLHRIHQVQHSEPVRPDISVKEVPYLSVDRRGVRGRLVHLLSHRVDSPVSADTVRMGPEYPGRLLHQLRLVGARRRHNQRRD